MTAFIGWVDSSSAERERVRRAIALFDEKDTRDELGIGTVRDAFANAFFPGTSTIETRLRYCLFVPWICPAAQAALPRANFASRGTSRAGTRARMREEAPTLGRASMLVYERRKIP